MKLYFIWSDRVHPLLLFLCLIPLAVNSAAATSSAVLKDVTSQESVKNQFDLICSCMQVSRFFFISISICLSVCLSVCQPLFSLSLSLFSLSLSLSLHPVTSWKSTGTAMLADFLRASSSSKQDFPDRLVVVDFVVVDDVDEALRSWRSTFLWRFARKS